MGFALLCDDVHISRKENGICHTKKNKKYKTFFFGQMKYKKIYI